MNKKCVIYFWKSNGQRDTKWTMRHVHGRHTRVLTDNSRTPSRLSQGFKRLIKANLTIQPDECEFIWKITQEGIKPNPSKVECNPNLPQPQNQKIYNVFPWISRLLNAINFQLCHNFQPLTRILQKGTHFNFDSQGVKSFHELKHSMTTSPILYPNFYETFLLTTDSSAFAIGGLLLQHPIGKDFPIDCVGSEHFRPYLFAREFKLIKDHRTLTLSVSINDTGIRLARCRLKLEEYNYKTVYKPSEVNKNADALSPKKNKPSFIKQRRRYW